MACGRRPPNNATRICVPASSPVVQGSEPRRSTAVAVKATNAGDIAAPSRIVAKGQGAIAEQILALAFATGVKVREDADLVEVLEAIEIDSEVPLHALAAVAEILSYVYRANRTAAGQATHDPEPEQ